MKRREGGNTSWRGLMLLGAVERRGAFVVGIRDVIVIGGRLKDGRRRVD